MCVCAHNLAKIFLRINNWESLVLGSLEISKVTHTRLLPYVLDSAVAFLSNDTGAKVFTGHT